VLRPYGYVVIRSRFPLRFEAHFTASCWLCYPWCQSGRDLACRLGRVTVLSYHRAPEKWGNGEDNLLGACDLSAAGNLFFLWCPTIASHANKPRPPKPEELVGVWIGFWEDGQFTHLDLRNDFTGYGAFVAPVDTILHQQGSSIYRVTRWSIDCEKFAIDVTPIDSRLESIYLSGPAYSYALDLEVGGTKGEVERENRIAQGV
jgi:hypothetical protein